MWVACAAVVVPPVPAGLLRACPLARLLISERMSGIANENLCGVGTRFISGLLECHIQGPPLKAWGSSRWLPLMPALPCLLKVSGPPNTPSPLRGPPSRFLLLALGGKAPSRASLRGEGTPGWVAALSTGARLPSAQACEDAEGSELPVLLGHWAQRCPQVGRCPQGGKRPGFCDSFWWGSRPLMAYRCPQAAAFQNLAFPVGFVRFRFCHSQKQKFFALC